MTYWTRDKNDPVRTRENIMLELIEIARELDMSDKAVLMCGSCIQVETAGPTDLQWWCFANDLDPFSQEFPHDGVGQDKESSGYYQQRAQWWGGEGREGARKRMTLRDSTIMFLEAVKKLPYDYNSNVKSLGLMVQDVQHSGHPERYDNWGFPIAYRIFKSVQQELLIPGIEGLYV